MNIVYGRTFFLLRPSATYLLLLILLLPPLNIINHKCKIIIKYTNKKLFLIDDDPFSNFLDTTNQQPSNKNKRTTF